MGKFKGMRIGRYLKGMAIVSLLILPSACFNNDSKVSSDNNEELQRVPLALADADKASTLGDMQESPEDSPNRQPS